MHQIKTAFLPFLILLTVLSSCSRSPENWTELLPADVSMVVVPGSNVQSSNLLNKEYVSLLDDITPSAIQQVTALIDSVPAAPQLRAIGLIPVTSTSSDLLWVFESPETNIADWSGMFFQPFSQTDYFFREHTIYKLYQNKRITFAAQSGDWLILSVSSYAIEQAIRTIEGEVTAMDLPSDPQPGSIHVNTPELDTWAEQLMEVLYRPSMVGALTGSRSVSFRASEPDTLGNIQLEGVIPVQPDSSSELVQSFSGPKAELELDRYIAGNAAAFAILRKRPYLAPPAGVDNATALDSLLLSDSELYRDLASSLSEKFAVEAFPESGLMASGEYLYMRKIANMGRFRDLINRLVREGLITIDGSTYKVNSSLLARMIGSEMCDFRSFNLDVSNDVVVIAKRRGLAETVSTDRERRRVIYYDDTYSTIRDEIPDEVSAFMWIRSQDFLQFLQPFLKDNNMAGGLLNRFNILTITMESEEDGVHTRIRSYKEEGSSLPYRELWVLPLSNASVTGTPVLSNLLGSVTEEIIFATDEGRVIALAADGTIALQTRTGNDRPIGSPLIYDWYGNGQPVIMIAAGDKIYAWNNNGTLLPNFPISMQAGVSAPIVVQDVLRNGVPEILVATEDRQLHLLNARGEDVSGWPKTVNAMITQQPAVQLVEDSWSVWAVSQNTIHSWLRNGTLRPGYPKFINARFTDTPLITSDRAWGTAADGYLYSVGTTHSLSDSLAMQMNDDSVSVRSLYVSNQELFGASIQENILLRDSTGFFREDLISMQSLNGSVFMYNQNGELRFTQSLGQSASRTFKPDVTDINGDNVSELIALGEYGRLYVWEILTGERVYEVPTSGMTWPLITDLNGDGQKELIAQTREGLRCWTIYKKEDQ